MLPLQGMQVQSLVRELRSHMLRGMAKTKQNKQTNKKPQKQTHRLRERTYGYRGEGLGGGIDWEFGIDMYMLLYLKWITNKDTLYSTGNAAQYSVIT